MNEHERRQSSAPDDDEVDLRELFRTLWAGKWLIGGITFAAAVIAVAVVLMLPNIYRAEALLAPNDQEAAGGLSSLAAQYGGLASLAGININAGSADRTELGIAVLQSRKFISEFIQRHDLLVPLIATDAWDWETDELQIDPDMYDIASEKWVRDVDPPKQVIPSMQEAYEEFIEILHVSKNDESGFVSIAIDHYSPNIARQWVEWMIRDINNVIMLQDVAEAEQAIRYLKDQIEKTSLSGLQSIFFKLIEEQTKIVMLANVSDEYLLTTIDPPVAPEKKDRPKRAIIVILVVFGSIFLAILGVLTSHAMRY